MAFRSVPEGIDLWGFTLPQKNVAVLCLFLCDTIDGSLFTVSYYSNNMNFPSRLINVVSELLE